MGVEGMDLGEVRAFANALTKAAETLENLVNEVAAQLAPLSWTGADAARFRSEWDSEFRPRLQSVASAFYDAASVANANAAQQEQASAS